MSAPKRNALGRGLAALIPGAPAPGAPAPSRTGRPMARATATRDGTRTIAVEEIHPSPGQPRTSFDDARLDELAASIKTQGIIQPLIVRARSAARAAATSSSPASGAGGRRSGRACTRCRPSCATWRRRRRSRWRWSRTSSARI